MNIARLSFKWGETGNIVLARVLTIPGAAGIPALGYLIFKIFE